VIFLVRHGQTAANARGLLLGREDLPLTDLGVRQAAAAGPVVAGVSRVVTSPLRRARETATALGLSVPVEIDDRWTELDYGELEGRRLAEVPTETWRRWREDPTYSPPGGESIDAVGRRVRDACERLAVDSAGADVAVVSHVSPIKAAVAWALGVGDGVAWRMFLDVASISRVATGPQGPSLRGYNDTHHLPAL
jgi:broad specificity phosphatase PhoE